MTVNKDEHALFGNGDEPLSNSSSNSHLNEVIGHSRRTVVKGAAAASVLAFLGGIPNAVAAVQGSGDGSNLRLKRSRVPFEPVPVFRGDQVIVPPGYTANVFIPWGTPITGRYPAYLEDASNSAQDQAEQLGMHHDGMHFFPIDIQRAGRNSDHGLLVLNHEYIDAALIHPQGPTVVNGKRVSAEEVRKEINAHGVSVVEVRRAVRGDWTVVPSSLNRRITGATPMMISGPARGHALLRTSYSPDGTMTRGTLNNCSHGATPWGTYLTCEENWAGYFASRDGELPRELSRYGVRGTGRYGWETIPGDEFERFDATRKSADASADYRNEPNMFGWVVEIDPFDPNSTPVKRTALGRYAHEGVVFAPARPGKPVVCYAGDDSQNEYIYKYVSRENYHPRRSNGSLLDDGTLYVARFNADGSGDWLPLDINDPAFQQACSAVGVTFADQGEVLINTRLAADVVGATKMDRPEWGAVHPDTGEVYFTLTNNKARSEADEPNPRAPNPYGHIIRWREASRDHVGLRFDWDIYILAGPEDDSRDPNGRPLDERNTFASPDGLWFDDEGRLWVQTDMSGSQLNAGPFGNNQMLVSDPKTGETKRFLVGPKGAEVTGVTVTPDFRTMFVNIQHPGEGNTPTYFASNWPDGQGRRPRSATVVITRDDGRRLM
jgi:secreted PhoX family phosphatase